MLVDHQSSPPQLNDQGIKDLVQVSAAVVIPMVVTHQKNQPTISNIPLIVFFVNSKARRHFASLY